MSSQTDPAQPEATIPGSPAVADRFVWHPRYRGQTLDAVRAEIERELASDQRAYGLVLEGAERQENAALASVIELERKWGAFDMNWAESNPAPLAARIAAFEQAREARREMIPYAAYRAELAPAAAPADRAPGAARPRMGASRPPLLWAAIAAVAVLILLLFLIG